MLSIGSMGNGQGSYYVGLAAEDYYLQGGEPPGQWVGEGARLLGLTGPGKSGQVERDEFLQLFAGLDKEGRALVQNAGASNRQPGWDLTFSAPKSVSVVWVVSDAETRRAIQDAHFAALQEGIAYIQEGATTRRGKGGVIKEPAQLLVATFEHGTSRAQDPQLHTHCLVLNMAVRADGTTGALESQEFYRRKMAAGALYQAEFSHRLQRMGFEIEPQKVAYEIKGVPDALQEEFSKRRVEIESRLEKQGKTSARAAAFAALDTRQVKEHLARDVLFREWQEVAARYNFTDQQAQELRTFAPPRSAEVELPEVLGLAVEKISRDQSHWGERELLRAAAQESLGRGLSAAQLRAAVKAELQGPDFIPVGEHKREDRYTTRELWETEKTLLATAADLHQQNRHTVENRYYLQGILKAEERAARKEHEGDPPVMNPEQRKALAYITKESGRVALVSGMAGTGKTFLLDAAREAWEAQGYKVIGASVTGKAARGLETGAGIQSTTVARLSLEWERGFEPEVSAKWARKVERLHATWQIDGKTRRELLSPLEVPKSALATEWQYATWQISKSQKEFLDSQRERRERFELDQKTVLVVDEAGMLGTRQMAGLLKKSQETGAKIVYVGEQRQIQATEVGGPFGSLHQRLGGAELTEIIRQKEKWQRQAVKDFADGKADKALQAYQEKGCLTVAPDREAAKHSLVEAWKREGITAPEKNVIFAGTRADTKALNRMAQEERQRAKKLGFRALQVAGATIHEKDRVLFTQNKEVLGVQNGTTGTVLAVDAKAQTLRVKLDSGQETLVPCREYQELTLGYALTTHKGQGMTVKNSYVLCGGPMADREISYVQASRATDKTEFFSEQISIWNPDTQRREEATLSELARRMSQSRQKDLAHDVARTKGAERQPGIEREPHSPSF